MKIAAALLLVAGVSLLAWSLSLWVARRSWLRRIASTRSRIASESTLLAEEPRVYAVLKRKRDSRVRRGWAALFLTRDCLWIEVDRPSRSAPVEARSLLRAGVCREFEGMRSPPGQPFLYLAWRQEPDGLVESAFAVANASLWRKDLTAGGLEIEEPDDAAWDDPD